MKFLHALLAVIALGLNQPAYSWPVHGSGNLFLSNNATELVPNFLGGFGEYPFLNMIKGQDNFIYGDGTGSAKPDELDASGYPIPGSNIFSHSGVYQIVYTWAQSSRPGDWILSWTGSGDVHGYVNGNTGTAVACTGTGTNTLTHCNNTACTSFQGYTAGTTLTVTSAPTGTGCSLVAGVPISGSGLAVSTFDVPTFITSAGSACGPNTCYTINISQTVGSSGTPATFTMGGRMRVSSGDLVFSSGGSLTSIQQWHVGINASTVGNAVGHLAMYQVQDESAYWAAASPCPGAPQSKGCIVNPNFADKVAQGGIAVIRDLNWQLGNISSCSTWSTRKPVGYYSYAAGELRNASSSGPGAYVNATGTGASGGTVSYNAGTDTYSISVGSGDATDKQSILVLYPATGTFSSKVSLNGNTSRNMLSPYGSAIVSSTYKPTSGQVSLLVFDAALNSWMNFAIHGQVTGFNCGVPPEVVVELNAEMNTTPWYTLPHLSLMPMSDWTRQLAALNRANYTPPQRPIFEPINENWNCSGGVYNTFYLSAVSATYIAADPAWTSAVRFCGSSGNLPAIGGKAASTVGQDLQSVMGSGNYYMTVSVWPVATPTQWVESLSSASYINQNPANIPTQSGYTKTAAWTYAKSVAINNYWNTGISVSGQITDQNGAEAKLGYCYFNYSVSTACQSLYASQQAVMDAKMNSSLTAGINSFSVADLTSRTQGWQTALATCLNGASRPAGCNLSATYPADEYEGGFNEAAITLEYYQQITATSSVSTNTVLSVANNGCVAGMKVRLGGPASGSPPFPVGQPTGGTWSTASGTYTVISTGTDSSHCAINLDSSSLGTMTAGNLIYDSSPGYVNYLKSWTYLQSGLTTLTATLFNNIVAAGGQHPSQFNLAASSPTSQPWFVWTSDTVGGSFPVASCTSCTISTNQMTLGGTIKGIFTNGLVVLGKGVTGVGTGAGSNTTIIGCSTVGSGPCGSQAGDILTLSQNSTVAAGTSMLGTVAPSVVSSDNSSAVGAWKAICTWNGTGARC